MRAARKLIDVDRVVAIMGTWASSVTTAVAPLCWESKTFLTTVSGSDTITQLPHQGYLIRTQPNTNLQIGKLGEFLISLKVKRVFVLAAQTPFALPSQKRLTEVLPKGGGEVVGAVIYDKDKTTFRSEIDQALRAKPDMIYLNGYTPDCTVLMKELYKAGYTGAKVAQGYAVNQKLLDSMPAEVSDGIYTVVAVARRRVGRPTSAWPSSSAASDLDPYSCQCHDHISLVALAIARAKGEATGTADRATTCARSRRAPGSQGRQRGRRAEARWPRARRSTSRAPAVRATSPRSATSSTASSATSRPRAASSPS